VEYDEDAVLDPRAKARLEKQRELESDLSNATELFGSVTVKGGCVENEYSLLICSSKALACVCVLRLVRRGSRRDPEIDSQV
jgi:hypothetical protein